MCRAIKVLVVAEDDELLAALKHAAVSAERELCRGATDADEALAQLAEERPQRLVVFGPFEALIAEVSARDPALVIVSDRDAPGAIVATSVADVRGALDGVPRPGGPVGA
jgi:hypothetical protein